MEIANKCQVCGGTLVTFSGSYTKCKYCGQVYSVGGESVSEEIIYQNALASMQQNTIEGNQQAKILFDGISGYKDSAARAKACLDGIKSIEVQLEEQRLAEQRNRELAEQKKKENAKKRKKGFIIGGVSLAAVMLLVIGLVVIFSVIHIRQRKTYNEAVALYNNGNYEEARDKFIHAKNIDDAKSYLENIDEIMTQKDADYEEGIRLYEQQNYSEAIARFSEDPDYKESREYIDLCSTALFQLAQGKVELGLYDEAKVYLDEIPESANLGAESEALRADIEERIQQAAYDVAVQYFDDQEYEDAQKAFGSMLAYKDSKSYIDQIGQIYYDQAKAFFDAGDYVSCVAHTAYCDEQGEWSNYQQAVDLAGKAEETHVNNIRQQAVNTLNEQGYDAFESYVNSAVDELFNDNQKKSLLSEYADCKPMYLTTMEAYYKGDWIWKLDDTITDTYGNTYEHSATIGSSRVSDINTREYYDFGRLTYLLNGKYNHIDMSLCFDSDTSVGYIDSKGYVQIIVDGEVIYTSSIITNSTNPEYISIDLGDDVNMLTIDVRGDASGEVDNWSFDAPILIASPKVSKIKKE